MNNMIGLVQRVTESDMWNRQQSSDNYKDKFTYGAIKVLREYYEDLSDGIGEPIEFDYVGIVCDRTEYTPEELASDFGDLDRLLDYLGGNFGAPKLVDELMDQGYTILVVDNLKTNPCDGTYITTYLVQE